MQVQPSHVQLHFLSPLTNSIKKAIDAPINKAPPTLNFKVNTINPNTEVNAVGNHFCCIVF